MFYTHLEWANYSITLKATQDGQSLLRMPRMAEFVTRVHAGFCELLDHALGSETRRRALDQLRADRRGAYTGVLGTLPLLPDGTYTYAVKEPSLRDAVGKVPDAQERFLETVRLAFAILNASDDEYGRLARLEDRLARSKAYLPC